MYDSVSHAAIPRDAELIAVYDDGAIYGPQNPAAWPPSAFALFPNAEFQHITVTGGTLTADWADVEAGDLDEAGACQWLYRQSLAGLPRGGVYASLSRLGSVVAVCGLVRLWSAHYTGVEHICTKETCWRDAPNLPADFLWELVVATQWVDHGPAGQNYDISLLRLMDSAEVPA